ncbi:MAG: ABC transporter permease [Pseudomonadota bacterium]
MSRIPIRILERLTPYFLLLPALVVFGGIFVTPVVRAFMDSLAGRDGALGIDQYRRMFETAYGGDLLFTLAIGFGAASLSVLISIPIALVLRRPFQGRTLLYALVLFPLVVPHIIAAYGLWLSMGRGGPVFNLITTIGLLDRAPMLSREPTGLLIALVWKHFPITTLTIAAALESIDPALEEAGRDLGAGPMRRLAEIVLPLAIPGLLAGFVLVFILSASGFSIPLIVYSGKQIQPLPLGIYYEALAKDDWAFASALGVALTTASLVLLGILTTAIRRIYRESLAH